MDGAWSQQLVRLLRRSSVHHQPSSVAIAIALGVLAGLVPKANLLGVTLCLGLVLLPIHNLAAIAVCLLTTCVSRFFDPYSHQLGTLLLLSDSLLPIWRVIDNAAILPWLGLQNTVVMGSLIFGLLQLGPCYVLSMRILERLCWLEVEAALMPDAAYHFSARSKSLQLSINHSDALLLPAPHFLSQTQLATSASSVNDVTSQTVTATSSSSLEPHLATASAPTVSDATDSSQATAPINHWHIGSTAKSIRQKHLIGAPEKGSAKPTSRAAEMSADYYKLPEFRSELAPNSSLEVARSAAEMIAWVDEALEDCLASDLSQTFAQPDAIESAAESVVPPIESRAQETVAELHQAGMEEQWLMETTIEIVRWADHVSFPLSDEASNKDQAHSPDTFGSDENARTIKSASTYPMASADTTHSSSATHDFDPSTSKGSPLSIYKSLETMQSSIASTHSASRSMNNSASSERETAGQVSETQRPSTSDLNHLPFPQHSEALGYLLQHLRESRDGSTQ